MRRVSGVSALKSGPRRRLARGRAAFACGKGFARPHAGKTEPRPIVHSQPHLSLSPHHVRTWRPAVARAGDSEGSPSPRSNHRSGAGAGPAVRAEPQVHLSERNQRKSSNSRRRPSAPSRLLHIVTAKAQLQVLPRSLPVLLQYVFSILQVQCLQFQ